MASVGSAVEAACKAVRAKIEALPAAENGTPRGADYAETMRRQGLDRIEASAEAKPSGHGKFSAYAFGAVFAEVRVDASLGTIRVPRIVGAYDVGRVVNPKIARSQCLGGMVGGIGMALLERAEWDARFGRVMNANMAEYLIPVNADVGELEVLFVPGDDRNFNPLGVKGVAEVALCGVAPAIANAVYHATGKRIRELPITLDKVLDGAG
jgi:xanthine dehydrogenase YagR molybdenum-binding subunit